MAKKIRIWTGSQWVEAGVSAQDLTGVAYLNSPVFTGVPASPTAAVDTNTTQIATTAFVINQGYLKSSTASSTYLSQSSANSTFAPLSSPSLTGTPTAPTATSGNNTTQIATTAFVQSAISSAPSGVTTGKAIAMAIVFGG